MVFSPFIAAGLAAAGAAALARFVAKEWQRVNETLHPQEPVPVRENEDRRTLKTLRRDPRTGIYRPD
jgi:hypothetical protein